MIELKCDTCGKVIGYVDEVGGYADFAYQVWYCLEHGYKDYNHLNSKTYRNKTCSRKEVWDMKKLLPLAFGDNCYDKGTRDPLFMQRMKNWVNAVEPSTRLK